MSFQIHVSAGGRGTSHFVYERMNVPDGDPFELGFVERQILSRAGIRDRPSPTGAASRVGLQAMSRIAQIHMLVTVVEMLMTRGTGTMNVAVRHRHLIRPDTGGVRTIPIEGPSGAPVAGALVQFLDAKGMNHWGHILEITAALSNFRTSYTGGSGYLINLTLFD